MLIAAITGKKRSGKDSLADYIVDQFKFVKLSFAYKLKEVIKDYTGCVTYRDEDREYDQTFSITKKQIRQMAEELSLDEQKFYDRFYEQMLPHLMGVKASRFEYFMSYRKFAQILATDVCRYLNDNIWIEQVGKQIKESSCNYVFSDVRFDNEAKYILENGGHVIHIVRPSLQMEDEHVSEQGVDPLLVSVQIKNDGTLDDLKDTFVQYYFDVMLKGGKI